MEDDYLHDEELAALLEISLKALRNKVAAGDPLPPRINPPGMRVRIWPRAELNDWMRQFLAGDKPLSEPLKLGRPRKAQWQGHKK